MKKYRYIYQLICAGLLLAAAATAQTPAQQRGAIYVYPTQQGNLVRIFPLAAAQADFGGILRSTSHFEIRRGRVVEGKEELPVIGKATRATSARQFAATLGAGNYADFKRFSQRATDAEVTQFLKNEYSYDSLARYTVLSKEALIGLGLGYFDTQAPKDSLYTYEAYRVDVSGEREAWGNAMIGSRIPNPLLNKVHVQTDSIITTDSASIFRFLVKIPSFESPKGYPSFPEIDEKLPLEQYLVEVEKQRLQLVDFLNTKPLTTTEVKFNVYASINDNPEWKLVDRQFAAADSAGNLRISAFLRTNPEDKMAIRVVPEDYAGATGEATREFSAYALSKGTVPLIYGLFGSDSTNCVKLTWAALPLKPYYTGLLLERSHDGSTPVVLATLEPRATKYEDYDIQPGVIYNYAIRALFAPKQNVTQDMPASVSLSGNKFSAPLPPFNLQIDTTATAPTLTWEAAESKSRFAFYVYRGLSPDALELVSPTLKEAKFTDTTASFSGKLTYYYAVLEQNLTQDTSAFSNVVLYQPKVAYEVVPPTFINAQLVNGEVLLNWNDVRNRDKYVGGYQVERRRKGETAFMNLTSQPITTNFFSDTTFVRGQAYEYRVASVAVNNVVGAATMPTEVDFPLDALAAPSSIALANGKDGVLVSWPTIEVDRVKEYIIYRSSTEGMKELARVPRGNFRYEDKAVTPDEAYTYLVSIVDTAGKEGAKSRRKSINRQIPKSL